jgi:hypothetical protein
MYSIVGFIRNKKISNLVINKSLFLMKNRRSNNQPYRYLKINNSLNIYCILA